ncbi:MAG: glycosyltransferase [Bacillota bacterium]|nr:glycosyltransferase [Bacillota bacterium]
MKNGILWEIENIQIKKLKNEMYLHLEGWAFSKNKKELSYALLINDKNLSIELLTTEYKNIQKIYEPYLDTGNIGFSIHVPLQEEVQSLCFMISSEEEVVSYVLSKEQIQDIISFGEIEYSIEEFKYDLAKGEYHLTGFAREITGASLQFMIMNQDNQEVCFEKSFSTENNGFKFSFSSAENQEYTLIIQSIHDQKRIPLISETKASKIPTSKLAYTLKKGMRYLRRNGIVRTAKRVFLRKKEVFRYNEWLKNQEPNEKEYASQAQMLFPYSPKISVIVATFNTKESYLKEMIDSLVEQSYSNWELCIADGSTTNDVECYVKEHYGNEERIVFKKLEKNYGISGNMNAALEMVTGEYVGLFDHDDLLTKNCLFEIVSSLQEKRHDVIYTDEDKLDDESHLFVEPHFKPDFSIDQLCSHNYITHFFVVHMNLVKKVGGLREEYDGSQDHDFILRCCEEANSVHHIPKILYHWRMHLASTAMNPESKMYCYTSGKKAVQAHYDRQCISATSQMMPYPLYGMYRSYYQNPGNPLVSVIISNIKTKKDVEQCLSSLQKKNTYANLEILLCSEKKLNVKQDIPIHYISSKNEAISCAQGDYLLFIDSQLSVLEPHAIEEMLGIAMRTDTGCVGAKILNKKGNIEHCGIVFDSKGMISYAFSGLKEDAFGYMGKPLITCNYSLISSACFMMKKRDLEAVGGFEESYDELCSQMDLCLKLRSADKVNVVNVFSVWQAEKSIGKKKENLFSNILFKNKWEAVFQKGDPFHNVNFNYEVAPFMVPYKKEF